jgi:hypothetical protein
LLLLIWIVGQRNRKGPQFRDQRQHLGLQCRNHRHGSFAGFAASVARIRFVGRTIGSTATASAAAWIWGVGRHAGNAWNFEWSL